MYLNTHTHTRIYTLEQTHTCLIAHLHTDRQVLMKCCLRTWFHILEKCLPCCTFSYDLLFLSLFTCLGILDQISRGNILHQIKKKYFKPDKWTNPVHRTVVRYLKIVAKFLNAFIIYGINVWYWQTFSISYSQVAHLTLDPYFEQARAFKLMFSRSFIPAIYRLINGQKRSRYFIQPFIRYMQIVSAYNF